MSWVFLIIAGILEGGWTMGLIVAGIVGLKLAS
jgi:multidrug transporter EmrE-like cation transporter